MKPDPESKPLPWPFPQWNGTRWVMPAELLPEDTAAPEPDPLEEAPF